MRHPTLHSLTRGLSATLVSGLLAGLPLATHAGTPAPQAEPGFTALHSFSEDGSRQSGGARPSGALVQAPDGMFYGVSQQGGKFGLGALYRMTGSGSVTTLVSFSEATGTAPRGPLTLGSDGNLYGVTRMGGTCADCGTLFRLSADGRFKVLHKLRKYAEGAGPNGGLLQAQDGNFYGTAYQGGANSAGSIFRMTPAGATTRIYSFNGSGAMPYSPASGLIQASDGLLYGTTTSGGDDGGGAVYRLDTQGALDKLFSFRLPTGTYPVSGVVEGQDGYLYGTTSRMGPFWPEAYGTVYRVSKAGSFELLAQLDGAFGRQPWAGLMLAADGNFYGATREGAAHNLGALFRMAPGGALSLVHAFDGSDGANPTADLVQGRDGLLYGTTTAGGASGVGSIFRVAP